MMSTAMVRVRVLPPSYYAINRTSGKIPSRKSDFGFTAF